MPLAVGSRLGAYGINSLIGEGGMGEVYRARDMELKREVAIKVLPEHWLGVTWIASPAFSVRRKSSRH